MWVDAQVDLHSPPLPPVVSAAATALTTAREIADPGALANALEAAAWVQLMLGNRDRAAELSEEAGDAALVAHEWVLFNNTVYCAVQSTTGWLTPGSVSTMRRRRMDLIAANAPHGYVAWLAASEAHDALTIGAWGTERRGTASHSQPRPGSVQQHLRPHNSRTARGPAGSTSRGRGPHPAGRRTLTRLQQLPADASGQRSIRSALSSRRRRRRLRSRHDGLRTPRTP